MKEVRVYSDGSCTHQLTVRHIGQTSQYGNHDGMFAFDDDDDTWFYLDDSDSYPPNTIWLTFSSPVEINCVYADNLGEGSDNGDNEWNGGIKLEVRNENGEWQLMFESTFGNTATTQSISLSF